MFVLLTLLWTSFPAAAAPHAVVLVDGTPLRAAPRDDAPTFTLQAGPVALWLQAEVDGWAEVHPRATPLGCHRSLDTGGIDVALFVPSDALATVATGRVVVAEPRVEVLPGAVLVPREPGWWATAGLELAMPAERVGRRFVPSTRPVVPVTHQVSGVRVEAEGLIRFVPDAAVPASVDGDTAWAELGCARVRLPGAARQARPVDVGPAPARAPGPGLVVRDGAALTWPDGSLAGRQRGRGWHPGPSRREGEAVCFSVLGTEAPQLCAPSADVREVASPPGPATYATSELGVRKSPAPRDPASLACAVQAQVDADGRVLWALATDCGPAAAAEAERAVARWRFEVPAEGPGLVDVVFGGGG